MKSTIPMLLPNTSAQIDEAGFLLANDFSQDSDNWVQLVPYGDYPHRGPLGPDNKPLKRNGKVAFPQGVIQRIDNETGDILVGNFKSLAGKLERRFTGLPWYVGHHDLDPIKYPDPKSYGWIRNLANRNDGVYGQVEWTPEGKDLVDKKSFKLFSPYFSRGEDTQQVAGGKGIVRPTFLKSVGFTNTPNMDVMPLANDESDGNGHVISSREGAVDFLIANAIEYGVLKESERSEWVDHFAEDFNSAQLALANAGTSEGAKKGWETRRAGMDAKDPSKIAAKVAAKSLKSAKGRKVTKPSPGSANKSVRAALAKPPPLPKVAATPPPLPKAPAPPATIAARVAASAMKLLGRSR